MRPGFVAVAGVGDGDQEMTARIERHREDRPASWTTLEVAGQAMAAWLPGVPADACLVVDCLGTLLSALLFDDATTPTEDAAEAIASGVVEALLARTGNTIVVTNEVGMGVVPVSESGRLFRDALGRANARLTDAADAAYLVVAAALLTSRRCRATRRGRLADSQGSLMTAENRLNDLLASIAPVDESYAVTTWARLDSLTKPPRSLGRLEELAARVAVVQRTERPVASPSAIVLMAGDHGVVAEGVSPYPQEVTVRWSPTSQPAAPRSTSSRGTRAPSSCWWTWVSRVRRVRSPACVRRRSRPVRRTWP